MLTRRSFLKRSLATAPSALLVPALFERAVALAAQERSTPVGVSNTGRTLIVIQMAGGNDGLNTVVPYTDGRYHDLRPRIGLAPETVLPLNDRLGLHPSLGGLKALWDSGALAVVENVGYENPSLSHFEAMHIWETADPLAKASQGWLASLVDVGGHPFEALNFGTSLSPALCCPVVPPPTVTSPDAYRLLPDPQFPRGEPARTQALQQLYAAYEPPAPYAALLEAAATSAQESAQQLKTLTAGYAPTVQYPATPLARGLQVFAALIARDAGLRVGYTLLGGFDTHSNQAQQHARQLQTLGDAVSAFYQDLQAQGKAQDVLVMTWSEFGRRAAENASLGTDHGTAAPLFLLGGRVCGGLYGDPPDLGNLDNGNLRYSTDFRSVYATVLEGWLGADSSAILGSRYDTLPALTT